MLFFGENLMIDENLQGQVAYVGALENYLAETGEDELDVEGIIEQIPVSAPELHSKIEARRLISVLDVGSGNGKKGLNLARWLDERGVVVRMDCVEPKSEQRDRLIENHQVFDYRYLGRVFPTTFDNADLRNRYDLVLLLHSLYEFPKQEGIIQGLERLSRIQNARGAGVVIIESQNADFERMKNALCPRFGEMRQVSKKDVLNTFQALGIKYWVGEDINFTLPLYGLDKTSDLNIGKGFDFLFSHSIEGSGLKKSDYEMIGKWIKENARVGNSGSRYLDVSDSCIWFYKLEKRII